MSVSIQDLSNIYGLQKSIMGQKTMLPDTRETYLQDQSLLNLFNILENSVQILEKREKQQIGSHTETNISPTPVHEIVPTYGTVPNTKRGDN